MFLRGEERDETGHGESFESRWLKVLPQKVQHQRRAGCRAAMSLVRQSECKDAPEDIPVGSSWSLKVRPQMDVDRG